MTDEQCLDYPRNSLRACLNTEWNIGLVNLPVKVFCWLGWYDPIRATFQGSLYSLP